MDLKQYNEVYEAQKLNISYEKTKELKLCNLILTMNVSNVTINVIKINIIYKNNVIKGL